ncbi:MAG: hypothetical protein ACRDP4_15785, partial [Nocardioidaceae bacterium]
IMGDGPFLVRWTAHPLTKAEVLGLSRVEVERALLDRHGARRRNQGAAGWRVTAGRLVVVYNRPDRGDPSAACIVTLWRQR